MGLTPFSRAIGLKLLMRCPIMVGLCSRHKNAGNRFRFTSRSVSCLAPMTAVGQISNVHDRQLLAASGPVPTS